MSLSSSYKLLLTLFIFSFILFQVQLTSNIKLNQIKPGGLRSGETKYFLLNLKQVQKGIGSDALAFKVNGIHQFADPDVIIAVNQQKDQFNTTTNALKVCQSWGQDVCILQNQQIISKSVERVNIAVFCEIECDFQIVVKRLAIQNCLQNPDDNTILNDQEKHYSLQCFTTFNNETDIRAIQFYVPSIAQFPNATKIKHLTFIAHNLNSYRDEVSPKIDLWVAPGNNIPQSDCSCRRGYTLFSRSIGTRVSGQKIKLGSNYTMLIQQILPNEMKLESEPVAMIEMLVELEQQVIDIGDKPSGSSFYSLKQGIVDQNEESCFRYNIKSADSDMIVILKVHTGAGTLYIGAGYPTFKDKQYKKNAYYTNDSQFLSYEQITAHERRFQGKTGYQFLCFYGSKASTFSMSVYEQPSKQQTRLIIGNNNYEYEIQQDVAKDLMFISSDVQKVEDLKFLLTTQQDGDVDMFIKPCDLVVSTKDDTSYSFTVQKEQSGRYSFDVSMLEERCKPTMQEMTDARMGHKNTTVKIANSTDSYLITGQYKRQIKIQQQCQGQMVMTKGLQFMINSCGYWVHLLNMRSTPQRVKLETKLYADDYEKQLNEQQISTLKLNRYEDLYLMFSVSDTKAKQIRVQIDPIHGDTDMFITKWLKPTAESFQFRSTRFGRVPDVITITKTKMNAFIDDKGDKDPEDNENNPLVGQYYILLYAYQDSTFNIVYSVKSQSQDDSDVSLSSIVHLKTNQPFSATLTSSHMLFLFNGDFDLNNGDDIKISVQNVETSEQISIFVTPVGKLDRPPATVDDYKFRASFLHPNYIIIKQADDIRLDGSFYIRLQRKISKDKPIKNGVKFRINVMTGKREFRLRNGESQQSFILPNEAKIGTFFVYHQLNPQNDVHINLNRLNGDKIKMFVGVGVEYPSAAGSKIQEVEQGEYLKLDLKMIKKLNPECQKALRQSVNIADECSIHIGVFPKVQSSFLLKQIDFSIKVMQENTIDLSTLIDGKSQKGFFKRNELNPQFAQSYTYSYKVPQFPQNGLYVTLMDYSLKNNKNLFFIAQVVPIDDKESFTLTMLNQKSPEIGDQNSWSYKSSDFAKHHYLKIPSGGFKRKQCNTKACYVLITVCASTSQFDQKYQILVASKVQSLPDQSITYGDVLPGYYSYFLFHNTCQDCIVRFFLNTISPGSGDADMYVNYSLYQNLEQLPTTQNSHFGEQSYKQDTLKIDTQVMKIIQKDNPDFTMAGFYMIGVYGGDKKIDQQSIQPMVHFSIRASTKTTNYLLLEEGISQGVKNATQNQINYFLWPNWGAGHFNVYVTPTIGDVDIWVNIYQGMILDDVQKSFPKSKQQATWSSNAKGTRNKLQLNFQKDMTDQQRDNFCVADCYFVIGVQNKLDTDYDILVDTLASDNIVKNVTIDKFLPLNTIMTQTCWLNKQTIYTVPFYQIQNQARIMYLKISKTVNFRNSIQYDIGTTRGGFDIHDDGVSEFLAVNLENTKNLGEYFNVFIEINCYDQIEYSIQVKKDWKIPIQVTTNQPISSTIYKQTVPDIYSFKYTHQIDALQVKLIKSKSCGLDLLVQIYQDDIFGLSSYKVPTFDTAIQTVKSDQQKNYRLLQTTIDLKQVPLNSQIVFQVLYDQDLYTKDSDCAYTLQIDAGAVVKMLIEDVFYQSSINQNVENKDIHNKDKMSIFEIANPYYSIDGDGDDDEEILMLTIEVKPCDQSYIGVFVSHVYVDEKLEINQKADNYSRELFQGKITLHLKANQPQYYIYIFKLQIVEDQKPVFFFVRAFYGNKHNDYTLAQNGKIQIIQNVQKDSGKGVTIRWGPVYRIVNEVQAKAVNEVRFVVKKKKGQGSLKSQCEMRASDSEVISYLQNVYEVFLNYEDIFGDQKGITVNVEAVPIQQWTENLLYEELYLRKIDSDKKSSTLWVYLTIIFGSLALFAIVLAIVFRKNLKKTETQLEFQMTDVRNVARIKAPSAAPYYNVDEEESEHDNKSSILKSEKDQEMQI